jgi:hypothetical protein
MGWAVWMDFGQKQFVGALFCRSAGCKNGKGGNWATGILEGFWGHFESIFVSIEWKKGKWFKMKWILGGILVGK